MTLADALQATARRNLSLQAARLEVARADAQLAAAWGQLLPAVAAGGRYSRADHADSVDLAGSMGELMTAMGMPAPDSEPMVVRRQDDVVATLSASVRLVDLRAWANLGAARRGLDVARLSVQQARHQLLLATGQAHALALTSARLVTARQAHHEAATHHLQAAERRVAEGTAVELDLVRARSDLAQAELELVQARRVAASACEALGLLVGADAPPEPLDSPLPDAATLLGGLAGDKQADQAQPLVERALLRRPDLRLARARVDLADRQVRAAYGALLPTLDLGWQGSYQVTEPSDMGDPDRTRWTAMLTLSVPLYSHSAHAQVRAQRALREQSRLQAAHAEQQAALAVRRALRDYRTAQASVTLAAQRLDLAQRGLRLAEAAFAAGAGSSLEVTDARQRATAADVGRSAAELDAKAALLVLLDAVGADLLETVRGGAPGPATAAAR